MTETAPQQGDIRLFNLPGISVGTQPCDDVHFGGVEIFNAGQWGLVCGNPRDGTSLVLAQVICQDLGFPFSSLMDISSRPENFFAPGAVAVTQVRCTGRETRLMDCLFPIGFAANGMASPGDVSGTSPVDVLQSSDISCEDDLGVICRRFEIEGVIRQVTKHTFTSDVLAVGMRLTCTLQVVSAYQAFPHANDQDDASGRLSCSVSPDATPMLIVCCAIAGSHLHAVVLGGTQSPVSLQDIQLRVHMHPLAALVCCISARPSRVFCRVASHKMN